MKKYFILVKYAGDRWDIAYPCMFDTHVGAVLKMKQFTSPSPNPTYAIAAIDRTWTYAVPEPSKPRWSVKELS